MCMIKQPFVSQVNILNAVCQSAFLVNCFDELASLVKFLLRARKEGGGEKHFCSRGKKKKESK